MNEESEKKAGLATYLVQAWLVLALAVCFGTALAVVEKFTRPRIEQNVRHRIAEKVRDIFGEQAVLGEQVAVEAQAAAWKRPKKIDCFPAWRDGRLIGWGILAEGQAYDTLTLLIGVDAEMETIKGYRVIKSAETPDVGDQIKKEKGDFYKQFEGIPARPLTLVAATASAGAGQINGISNATISSKGVVTIINEHLDAARGKLGELMAAMATPPSADGGVPLNDELQRDRPGHSANTPGGQ